jgi:hypothetical protein
MEYESGPTSYPTLGATLILDGSNISQVDHELTAEDSVSASEIAELSTQQLSILWDVIIYVSGNPARQADRRVQRVGTATAMSPLSTNLRTQTGQSAIAHSVRLPSEAGLLPPNGRLHAWLRLANEARPPASPMDAIRNYYMIWEDMRRRPTTTGSEEEELKFTRDFVSHGEPLKNKSLLAFLQRELGPGTQQYDPSNPIHQRFVEQRGEWARRLVESEINKYL